MQKRWERRTPVRPCTYHHYCRTGVRRSQAKWRDTYMPEYRHPGKFLLIMRRRSPISSYTVLRSPLYLSFRKIFLDFWASFILPQKIVGIFCRDAGIPAYMYLAISPFRLGAPHPSAAMYISSTIAALGCGAPKRFCILALNCQQGNEGCQNLYILNWFFFIFAFTAINFHHDCQ